MKEFGVAAASSSALAIAPFMPFGSLGEDELGAVCGEELAALDGECLGHREDYAVALGRGDGREGDARIAARRLDY